MLKALKYGGITLGVVFVALLVAPFLFKDKIKAEIDKALSKSVNATIYYDANSLSISLIRNFPNLSVSLDKIGVINKAPFAGDTLVDIGSFKAVVDIMSVISGPKMKIKGVYLDKLTAHVKVNQMGQANYDIALPDTTQQTAAVDTSKLSLTIEKWQLSNANIIYDDRTSDMTALVKNLNHEGSGDINADVYDLITSTKIDSLTYEMGGTKYLNKNKIDAQVTMNVDMPKSTYTFKDNSFKINDFLMNFSGFVALPDTENINMDVKFNSPQTEFKNILSLVPAVFLKDFEQIKTDGKLAFDGYAKGTMNSNKNLMPAYGIKLLVENGFFQYPSLPQPVKNINLDLKVDTKDGSVDNMVINLAKGHLEMGSNPIDAKALVSGLGKMNVDAEVKAKINLEEVTKIFPIEGTTLKGLYALDVKAKGVYDTLTKQMPAVDANMTLANGFAKTKDFASAIENIQMIANVKNATGKFEDTKANVQNMKFIMDGQPFELNLLFENFNDYTWDLGAKGKIDLTKITKIFPLDGMTLSGLITVNDFKTKGKMSLLNASKYDQMPTSGDMSFSNFTFVSKDFPQGMKINDGKMVFNPKAITIEKLIGSVGKSDINVTGAVTNYMSYTFGTGTLQGKMNMASKAFDVNEWMAEDPNAPKPAPGSEQPLQVVEVPKNIDFVLSSSMDKVLYSNYDITNLKGNIIIKEGIVRMDNVLFDMLGGKFKTTGTYDTKDIKDPKFDFNLDMKDVGFAKAYQTFSTVKALAPIAKDMEGVFSSTLSFNGKLQNDMMPLLSSLNGDGLMLTSNSKVKAPTLMTKISDITKASDAKDVILNDIKLLFKIENGRVILKKPLDFMAGGNKFTMTGSQGIDGTIDYLLKTQLPVSTVSKIIGPGFTQLSGKKDTDKMDIAFKALGPGTSPKVTPVAGNGESLDKYAKDQAKALVDAKKKKAEDSLKAVAGKAKADAEAKAKAQLDSAKKVAEAKANAEKERLKKEAENKLKNQAKDKLKNIGF
ncbi:MAG: AsmA-like C-terminal region-containing protein [Cytophagales bacterium]